LKKPLSTGGGESIFTLRTSAGPFGSPAAVATAAENTDAAKISRALGHVGITGLRYLDFTEFVGLFMVFRFMESGFMVFAFMVELA
jgi:hypothetical protein